MKRKVAFILMAPLILSSCTIMSLDVNKEPDSMVTSEKETSTTTSQESSTSSSSSESNSNSESKTSDSQTSTGPLITGLTFEEAKPYIDALFNHFNDKKYQEPTKFILNRNISGIGIPNSETKISYDLNKLYYKNFTINVASNPKDNTSKTNYVYLDPDNAKRLIDAEDDGLNKTYLTYTSTLTNDEEARNDLKRQFLRDSTMGIYSTKYLSLLGLNIIKGSENSPLDKIKLASEKLGDLSAELKGSIKIAQFEVKQYVNLTIRFKDYNLDYIKLSQGVSEKIQTNFIEASYFYDNEIDYFYPDLSKYTCLDEPLQEEDSSSNTESQPTK